MTFAKIDSHSLRLHEEPGSGGVIWISHDDIKILFQDILGELFNARQLNWSRLISKEAKIFMTKRGADGKEISVSMVPLKWAVDKVNASLWKGHTDLLDYLLTIGDHLDDIPDFNSRGGHFHLSEPMVSMTRTQGGFQTIIMPSVGM
jgi:hypothetical protein